MDKEQRSAGATILRFPVRDAARLAQRSNVPAHIPTLPDNGFDIDAWYHQAAIHDSPDTAKH